MLSAAQGLKSALEEARAHRGRNRRLTHPMRAQHRSRQLLRDSGGAFVRARRIGGIVPGLAKCPTCKERLGSVELQRLRVTGIMPRGVQLYVAVCPHCAASVPFAAMPVTATTARMIARAAAGQAPPRGRERARSVHESVSRLLAGGD